MKLPTLHLNGTNPSELLAAFTAARGSIIEAVELLKAAAPNGRDYYPQGDGAFNIAAREHGSRVKMLETVSAELYELAQHVVNSTNAP